jgi:hypothetical protein
VVDEDLMQEINISLESPREEEKGLTPERKSNEVHRPAAGKMTSAGRHQPLVAEEEESQEEVLEQEGVGSEFERGESMEESEEEKKESD